MTRGLKLARRAWVVAAATILALSTLELRHVWSEASSVGPAPTYFRAVGQYRLSSSQAQALDDIGLSPEWHAALVVLRLVLVIGTAVLVSALIWRRARTWAPLFLSWFLLGAVMMTSFSDDGTDGDLPGWLGLPTAVLFGGAIISMAGLLLVFPDDRSARWVVAILASAASVPAYAGLTDNDAIGDFLWEKGVFLLGGALLVGLAIQVHRVSRSGDRTGRDLLALTVAMLTVFVVLSLGADPWSGIDGSREGLWSLGWRLGFETVYMAIPLLYGLAVLSILVRRGHWDMDVQLKGSVGYAGLTTLLVLLYFGAVAVVQAVVNDVAGVEGSTFALMVSTALIAALFLPARARLQAVVDRIFDRRRRDAEQTVAAFETRVLREGRLDEVGGALLTTVDQVFRPEHADLWLAPETKR